MRLWAFLILLFALPAAAANDGKWHNGPDAGSGKCAQNAETPGVTSCFWNFDTAGQSVILSGTCPVKSATIEGTAFEVHPYHCTGTTFATECFRMQATNLETGAFGDVTLTQDDRALVSVPWNSILFDVQSGSGTIRVDCGG